MGNSNSKSVKNDKENLEDPNATNFESVSQFKIRNVIGKGSWSTVFVVKHRQTKQRFALKCINKKKHDEHKIKKLRNEVLLLQSLNHPLLCKFYSEFEDETKIYLVTDLMLGGDLRYHISQRKFNESVIRIWMVELVSALIYIHSKGVLHRDVKPDNILLDEKGHCKLADFNVAAKVHTSSSPSKLNMTVGRVGTPVYMAPETLIHAVSYKESDWWSLGITFYECLFQVRPFPNHLLINWIRASEEEKASSADRLSSALHISRDKKLTTISKDARSAVMAFLEMDIKKRLGHSSKKLQTHPFFCSISLETVSKGNLTPIFRPKSGKVYVDPILDLEATF